MDVTVSSVEPSDRRPLTTLECDRLTAALVYLGLKLGKSFESLEVRRLVSEIGRASEGTFGDNWWTWMTDVGRSLHLTLRGIDVESHELGPLVESGLALVVADDLTGELLAVERRSRGQYRLRPLGSDQPPIKPSGLKGRLLRAVVGDAQWQASGVGAGEHPHTPLSIQLWKLVQPDRGELLTGMAFAAFAGLLLLSVPVTAQQLIRSVTFGALYQPIVVLSGVLLLLLGFAATLQAMQAYIAEIVQRRLFCRLAAAIALRWPRVRGDFWQHHDGPELANRFLEIVTVQKVVATLLVDGVAIALSTVIGMAVMAFYHPYLLGYDVALIAMLILILFWLGRTGVRTAIAESRAKYDVLAALEDLARCSGVFRLAGADQYIWQKIDSQCFSYLTARAGHFNVLWRQLVLLLALQCLATTALLGLGGYLVLQEQLTIGQLVAAELIVATIVGAFTKVAKHLEGWYDVLAAVEKISHLLEMPMMDGMGLVSVTRNPNAKLRIRPKPHATRYLSSSHDGSIANRPPDLERSEITVGSDEIVVLWNWGQASTRRLRDTLHGELEDSDWVCEFDGVNVLDIRSDLLRDSISIVHDLDILPSSLMENIHLNRPEVSEQDCRDALDFVGLHTELSESGVSENPVLLRNGYPLTDAQCRLLVLARAVASRPKLILIDHLLDALPDDAVERLADRMQASTHGYSVLLATGRQDIAQRFSRVIIPLDGRTAVHTHASEVRHPSLGRQQQPVGVY